MKQTNTQYISISVRQPILQSSIKDSSSAYVSYLVTGKDSQGSFNIRRRFRQFDILRTKFVQRFIGLYIPSIPSKKITGNTEERVVQERLNYLDSFCQKIAQRPYLFDSDVFQTFIRGDADFQRATRFMSISQYTQLANVYDLQFRKYATQLDLPKITAEIQDEVHTLGMLEKYLVMNRNQLFEVVESKNQFIGQLKQCYQMILPLYEEQLIKMHDQSGRSLFFVNNNKFKQQTNEYFTLCRANAIQDYVQIITYDIHQVRAFVEGIQSRKRMMNKNLSYKNKKRDSQAQLEDIKNDRTNLKHIFCKGNKDDLIKNLQERISQYERNEAVIDTCLRFSAISLYEDLRNFKKNRSIEYLAKLQMIVLKQMRLLSTYGKMLSAALQRPVQVQSEPEKSLHFSFRQTSSIQQQKLQPKLMIQNLARNSSLRFD